MTAQTAYTILMRLQLASIAIMYQGSNTNPFQQSSLTTWLFHTALFIHVVVTMANMNLPTTMVIFHFFGLVGCEILLWILIPESWIWSITNLFILLVTSFCFFNFIDYITKLILPAQSNIPIAHPNLFILLVTSFCFFNFMDYITKLILPAQSNIPIAHPPNPEPQQEASASQA
ncbi:putative transmembrane protein [Trifolium medium]|uniref:Putative transmembrane protein n=1 Tax=Trifolium medium TaxID=97028 RepID=A0A392MZL2_9FABA|nr:putative transmembrane protein [Trifolium medium]